MPTIEFSLRDLEKLVGRKININDFEDEGVLFVKGELENEENGEVKVDIKDTNRPDLWSIEGIARELKGHYKVEEGIPNYGSKKSGLVVYVDKKVKKVRPKTVCAVVKKLNMNENSIKQLIQLQEKVCQTFGRNRDVAAIGVYDYDKIKGPINYTTFKPKELKFIPLGFEKEMDLNQIIKNHPKGVEYGHLLKNKKEYPIFIDSKKNVLSMPPIINSNYTGKVDEKTKNVFIEVSGHDINRISVALNVIVTALAERGGIIQTVDVIYEKDKITTPNLEPKKSELDVNYCRNILGMDISSSEMIKLLKQSRFDAKLNKDKIEVHYLPYRNDIMDQRDLIEEVAISFGYNDIEPEEPEFYVKGDEVKIEKFSNKIRELCVGFELQEIMNYTLTNKKDLLEKMKNEEDVVEIKNPISSNWSVFRNSLIPGCINFLSYNKHKEYPQKVFEIGDVIIIDNKKETKTRDIRKLSIVMTDVGIGYENISSILNSIMKNIGLEYKIEENMKEKFIEGRRGDIFIKNKKIGEIGEISPEVLENFYLEMPVVAMEIDLENIMKLTS